MECGKPPINSDKALGLAKTRQTRDAGVDGPLGNLKDEANRDHGSFKDISGQKEEEL